MAERLSGYVNGQKRFLGDIAHELSSPIVRIQVAIGILEQRAGDSQQAYIQDVREEVEHMSGLVSELLLSSKAGISAPATPLTRVNLTDTIESIRQREASNEVTIETRIDKQIEVMVHPD
jgi:two-component system sensor histidine kinase CpxA